MDHSYRQLVGLRQIEEATGCLEHRRCLGIRHAMPGKVEETNIPGRGAQVTQEGCALLWSGLQPPQVDKRKGKFAHAVVS
jgi:hypothetical protein